MPLLSQNGFFSKAIAFGSKTSKAVAVAVPDGEGKKLNERQSKESQKIVELERQLAAVRQACDHTLARARNAEAQLTAIASAFADTRRKAEANERELAALRNDWRRRLGAPFHALGRILSNLRSRHLLRRKNPLFVQPNPLFDEAYYLSKYPEVRETGLDPYLHYMRFGASEGREPNRLFNPAWYLRRYPDVKGSGQNPLLHFYLHGAAEGRDPHPLFSTVWYLDQHPELREQGINPLEHYLSSLKIHDCDP